MEGVKVADYSFKRKDQAITLATKAAIKVDGESIQVDTQLLFQRLVVAAKTDLKTAMEYELCTIPKSLFESPDLLHEPQKSALADTIWTMTGKKDITFGKDVSYVLDGGALIHRIPWVRGKTFGSIHFFFYKHIFYKHIRLRFFKKLSTLLSTFPGSILPRFLKN